jgi:hypothetical protein
MRAACRAWRASRQNRFVASLFRFNHSGGAWLINAIDVSFAEGNFRAPRYTSRLYIAEMSNLGSINAPAFSEKVREYF